MEMQRLWSGPDLQLGLRLEQGQWLWQLLQHVLALSNRLLVPVPMLALALTLMPAPAQVLVLP